MNQDGGLMPYSEEDKAIIEDVESNIQVNDENKGELEMVYGTIPSEVDEKSTNHSQEEAVEGSLDEDEGVIFDEISE